MYIGRTKTSLVARAGQCGRKYLALKYFGAAIKKYGWDNFKGEILLDNLTYEEACQKEKEYILLYKTQDSDFGYNLASGGEGPTKEALEKMRNSHKNRKLSEAHKANIAKSVGKGENNINYGRKQTEVAKLHNKLAKAGEKHPNWGKHLSEDTRRKISEGNSKPILQYSLDGEFIQEWGNIKIAANALGCCPTAINNCLRYIRHSSNGYVWIYKNEEDRKKYIDNEYILKNFGIRAFSRREQILKERNAKIKQEESSTTIPEMGVD